MSYDHYIKKAKEYGFSDEQIASGVVLIFKNKPSKRRSNPLKKEKQQTYFPLVGHCAYRYKRESKE